MKAIDLLCRYDKGCIDHNQTGIIENLQFDTLDDYVNGKFGSGSEVLFGELMEGKNYIYAYERSENIPSGFEEDDMVAMCVEDSYGWNIWIYEIEL